MYICTVCTHFYTLYIHFYTVYLFVYFIYSVMNMYETHGTVHSDSTVVVLLLATQTLQSLSTFCNAICYQHRHQPHVRCYSLPISSIRSPSQLITSNFPSILIVFRQFFTCIALDDVDSHFSLILVTKAIAVEGGTTPAA